MFAFPHVKEVTLMLNPAVTADEGWTFGDRRLFVLRGFDGGEENRLLDPTSIDVDSRGRIISLQQTIFQVKHTLGHPSYETD